MRKLISIHAPPRGATWKRRASGWISTFQFTPLREGRPGKDGHPAGFRHFNSRPSARGDARRRGAACVAGNDFNSRPSARGDLTGMCISKLLSNFNSRPSARGDLARSIETTSPKRYFNSRPSARGDVAFTDVLHCRNISIHAPPRGATPSP